MIDQSEICIRQIGAVFHIQGIICIPVVLKCKKIGNIRDIDQDKAGLEPIAHDSKPVHGNGKTQLL